MSTGHEPLLVTDPALGDALAQLMRREPIFHRPEFGATRADFENMIAEDFWEVGASGRRYSREYVLDTLMERTREQAPDVWETEGFHCQKLAENVYLLTYTLLQQKTRKTRRTTIWRSTPEGWKIVFHQGTLVEE